MAISKTYLSFTLVLYYYILLTTSAIPPIQHKWFKSCMHIKGIPSSAIVERADNSMYRKLNYQWNLYPTKVYPWAYFLPTSTKQVQMAVKCGRKSNVPLIPKSGGHSFEAYSFGNSSTVVIDFRMMASVQIDSSRDTARIGPGAQIGPAFGKLYDKGYIIPAGTSLKVGIGGQALGGGSGVFAAKYGLLMDSILEMTMVDAAGNAREVNAATNSDLFWALRGSASGYIGIVTSFTFKLDRVAGLKTNLVTLDYGMEDVAEVLEAWQNWMVWVRDNEPSIWNLLTIQGSADKQTVQMFSHYISGEGGRDSAAAFQKSIREIFPANGVYKESYISFMEIFRVTADLTTRANVTGYDVDLDAVEMIQEDQYFLHAKSIFVSKKAKVSEIRSFSNFIRQMPKCSDVIITIRLESFGGAVGLVPPTATGFYHRESWYGLLISCRGLDCEPKGNQWITEFMDRAKFIDNGESYQNFVDKDLGDTYLDRYYGGNKRRLLCVKKKWDPSNFFQNPQSIPVA